MDVSIIIVNYNVKYFLEQCLCSVQQAIENINAEVIIIDNNSTDGSVAYLQPLFSQYIFIKNKNEGFGKACNRGLAIARGRYILFLNPDTIIPENIFTVCFDVFKKEMRAGGIGVKMIDGSGNFLKESKRAFPSVNASFYKLFGITALFPKSAVFAKYHLGHLDENKNHRVPVLAGAFMLIKKAILDKIGGFDPNFFMYGEDIDLSYRIIQAGYQNYYIAEAPIIHFKGESTVKGSSNYVKMFYNAMQVFVNKHYGGSKKKALMSGIQLAIKLRAAMAMAGNSISFKKIKKALLLKENIGPTLVVAEPETYAAVQALLPATEKLVLADTTENTAGSIAAQIKSRRYKKIIFCQSRSLNYQGIISLVQCLPLHTTAGFHGYNTGSIVTSYTARHAGTAYAKK